MLFEQPPCSCRFVLFAALALSIFVLLLNESWGQEQAQSSLPNMSSLFDLDVETIPLDERPKNPQLLLPDSLAEVPIPVSADERHELSFWVRWLVLRNLPPSFEDNRKWGREKEVFDGIKLRREGWKIETKRKTKTAKHGTWSRYYIEFVDPAENLQVNIQLMEFPKAGPIRSFYQKA